ncbi:hypothetical protein [Salicibibacter kimchii]|uniref:Uncharacterized protein n=1 Tax=Salicibibacter kimchii TaxID=2099786 RepID=A0A345BXK3_9BACI|nr:hypothetical protein [Salicibibacter kimchii]AXF55684.1 hypothetical protein DT065_06370 [Salicibibacter kimchii]
MFELTDLPRLFLSALVVLPIVMVIRENGYYLAATLLGATNKKLTIGCGPILFSTRTLEVRRYVIMYSWMDYDELNPEGKFWHIVIYASPILTMGVVAVITNSLLANGVLSSNMFWDLFLFYLFFYILFDVLPVYLPDGQPTNGRAIFDLIWHGERSDFLKKDIQDHLNPERTEKDHSFGESENEVSPEDASTEAQKKTIENRDRDQEERGDHADPK